MRLLMTVSYDGTNYYGYQKQPNKRTIQEEIEKQLTKINSNKKVNISASGRTDRNVHAINQKIHFDIEKKNINIKTLRRSLNKLIPNDIYIKNIIEVDDDFHARFSVKEKIYEYKINLGEYNPIERNYVYQLNRKIDIESMIKASKYLIGEHNFRAFTKVDDEKEDYVRNIYNIDFNLDNDILTITFEGNGFLRYMVRNLVGSLIDVGLNKIDINDIKIILESRDRKRAGLQAPACGLYLKDVIY